MSWDLCHSPGRPHQQLFRLRLQKFFSRPLLRLLLFWAFFPPFSCCSAKHGSKVVCWKLFRVAPRPRTTSKRNTRITKAETNRCLVLRGCIGPMMTSYHFFLPPVSFLDLSGALRLKAALRASSEHTQTAKIQSSHGRRVKAPPLICAFINGTVAQGGDKNRSQSAAFCRLTVHPLRITTLDVT